MLVVPFATRLPPQNRDYQFMSYQCMSTLWSGAQAPELNQQAIAAWNQYVRSLWTAASGATAIALARAMDLLQLDIVSAAEYDALGPDSELLATPRRQIDIDELRCYTVPVRLEAGLVAMVQELQYGLVQKATRYAPRVMVRAPQLMIYREAYLVDYWLWTRIRWVASVTGG
jgi:hypothetical protein